MARAIALASLAGVAALVWWRLRVEGHVWVFDLNILNYDDYAYYYPTFRYGFSRLTGGEFPWWNPYQLCGEPFFANAQHVLLYPLNVLYLVLPTATAMKWTAIAHFALAIVFTFVCGRVFGLSRLGALTAGIVFAFSGSVVGLLYIPHHLYGAVWMPLVLALAELTWTRARPMRWGVALGAALASQYLGGYPMYSLFSAYLLAGHLVWRLAAGVMGGTPLRMIMRRVAAIGVAGAMALVLSAVQLLPAIELARQSPRAFGALSLQMVDPVFGQPATPWAFVTGLFVPVDANAFTVFGYVGLGTLVAVAVSPLETRRRRAALLFWGVAFFAWGLALGTYTPLYRLYFALPTGSWFRLPSRFLVPGCLALGLLAGVGVDALDRGRAIRAVALVAGAVVTGIAAWRVRPFFAVRPVLIADLGALAAWVAGATLLPAGRMRRAVVAAFPLLVYVELLRSFVNIIPIPEIDPHFHEMPARIVDYLRAHQGYERTYLFMTPLQAGHIVRVPLKSGMMYGLYTIADRENVYSERYQRYVARIEHQAPQLGGVPQGEVHVTARASNLRLLDLLGVRFVVESSGADFLAGVPDDRYPLLYEADGVRVRENPRPFPRVLVVADVDVVSEPDRVLDRLTDPGFDPSATVILEEPPGRRPAADRRGSPAGHAEIVAYAPEAVTIRAHADVPAYLVLTDQAYPGWAVRVDGRRAPIYRADYVFRAVPLEAGDHEVVFEFRPTFLRALSG